MHWSSGWEVGVLLEIVWYSGFLMTFSGVSCRVLLGQLISTRDVSICLVAMMGERSLDLARDYSIVVRVRFVIAGVLSLSSGSVQAPLPLWHEVHLYYQKSGSSLRVMSAGFSEVWLKAPLDGRGCVLSG